MTLVLFYTIIVTSYIWGWGEVLRTYRRKNQQVEWITVPLQALLVACATGVPIAFIVLLIGAYFS